MAEEERAFWDGLASGRLRVTLPTEAEWEKAARGPLPSPEVGRGAGGEGMIYPWGDDFDADKANVAATGLGTTSAVGCFPGGASPYGLLDMSGNVWEWTRSWWGKSSDLEARYPYDPGDGREDLQRDGPRVVRGGAFNRDEWGARCAFRYWLDPYGRGANIGFRAGVSLLPPGSGDSGALGL
jgi:formylglycine-generating enzyme required for sulfatase activity